MSNNGGGGNWRDALKSGGGGGLGRSFGAPVQERRVKVMHTSAFRSPARGDSIKPLQQRALLVLFLLTCLFAGMAGRLAYVALTPPAEPRPSIRDLPTEPGRRGNIYDKNGVLMAATVRVYSLYADPHRILDTQEAVTKLHKTLPELTVPWLQRVLGDRHRRFVWLKRRMTPRDALAVNALGLPGLEFREEYVRVYPHRHLASHVLGGVDVDNNGLAGIERGMNDVLNTGEDVYLGIDVRAQEILRQTVQEAVTLSDAKAGWGVVLDTMGQCHDAERTDKPVPVTPSPCSGIPEIRALVSLPDYDPNQFGKATDEERFDRAMLGSYEMGSTFKLFTLAEGIESGKIGPYTKIDCRYPLHIGRYTIKDYHAKHAILTAMEVMRYSSNVGAATIADMNGPQAQQDFLGKLGLLEPLDVGLPERGPVRYPSNWGRVQTFTISFGHGIMVTPMHLVTAVDALAGDGYYRVPTILDTSRMQVQRAAPRRVLKGEVLPDMKLLMGDVVTEGSGRNSQVAGLGIGGKTGTAEKIAGRGYAKDKNLVSFVGVVPVENPRYVVLVMVDEPSHAYNTGGRIAAPAVGKFIQRYALMGGLQPDQKELAALRAKNAKKGNVMRPQALAVAATAAPAPAAEDNTMEEDNAAAQSVDPSPSR